MKCKTSKKKIAARTALLAGGFVALAMAAPVSDSNLLNQWSNVIEAHAATPFSKYWFQDELGNWKIRDAKGNVITNAWLCDDAVPENGKEVWYLLDGNGNMISAGLVQDRTGNYYSLETNHNGYFGMLRYISGNYDGIHLNLESQHNGSFAKILNGDGLAALMAKYGVTVFNIDNNNCVYTSQFAAEEAKAFTPAKKNSGGGGGGGGSSSSGGGGSSSGGGGGGGSSSSSASKKQKAVKAVVNDFVDEYITEDMTDFEKEMMIIQYMVENIDYDWKNYENDTIPADSYSEYGALVKGVAVCDGYADAFMELAEACDLTVNKVSGTANGAGGWEGHAWNQIKLDGEWYNVDVTWEDPVTLDGPNEEYKFGNLRNSYINLTDETLEINHKWSSGAYECESETYNGLVVLYYMMTGKVDPEIHGDKWRRFLMFENEDYVPTARYDIGSYGCKLDDGSNYFVGENTEEQVLAYIEQLIADGHGEAFYITTSLEQKFPWLNEEWLRNNVGGKYALRDSGWYVHESTRRGEYNVYTLKYSYEDSPLLTQEQSRELLEQSLEENNTNLIATEDEMRVFIEKLIENRETECTIVFDGPSWVISVNDWVNTNSILKKPTETGAKYIAVDGKPYTICSYKLEYKDLSEMLGKYLYEDNSNLFMEASDGFLDRFKAVIDLPKEESVRFDYIVLKNAKYENVNTHKRELARYAEEHNADVRWQEVSISEGKTVSFDGDEYIVYQLRVPYYKTLDELLDGIPRKQLELDRSNFITPDETDKAAGHLVKMADAGKSQAFVVVYYEDRNNYHDRPALAETVLEAANGEIGNTEYQWEYVESPSYNTGHMREGDVAIFKFSWKAISDN